jgi:hypothetical protein
MRTYLKYTLLLLSTGALVGSVFLPSFETKVTYLLEHRMYEPGRVYQGMEVLALGWLGIVYGVVAWYANIGFIVSAIAIAADSKFYLPASIVSMLLALTSFTYPTISSDNGADHFISVYLPGFYLWLSAHVLILATALYTVIVSRRQPISANQ